MEVQLHAFLTSALHYGQLYSWCIYRICYLALTPGGQNCYKMTVDRNSGMRRGGGGGGEREEFFTNISLIHSPNSSSVLEP
jgi:hypothetical protein